MGHSDTLAFTILFRHKRVGHKALWLCYLRNEEGEMRKEITITYGELLMNYDWELACDLLCLNEWCINEGLVDSSDEVTLTEEQAIALGILEE